jgi:ligand-binding sensor domain-containing protein
MMRFLVGKGLGLALAGVWLAGGLAVGVVRAQPRDWQAHTSLREVVALAASTDALWAGTTGGLFSFQPGTGEITPYTPVEGLHSIQTQAVVWDERRNLVWVGYQDGVLDRLDLATGAVRTYRDLARADQFPSRQINRLYVRGDSLYVATAFGVVVFDPVRGEVRDTYSRLGPFTPATPVFDLLFAPTPQAAPGLWLATGEGVAWAPLARNLQDPAAWTAQQQGLTLAPGETSPQARAIATFNDRVYVGTSRDLHVQTTEGVYQRLGVTDQAVTDLHPTASRLYGVERFNLLVVEADGRARQLAVTPYSDPQTVIVGPDGQLWFGDRQGGLLATSVPDPAQTALPIARQVLPDGPFDGRFEDLTFDAEGNLWAANVLGSSPGSFYRFTPDGQWTTFSGLFFDELGGTGTFNRIHVDAEGHAWAASGGSGIAQVTPTGEIVRYTQSNSSLLPAQGTTAFYITGGVASDAEGNLWVTTRGTSRPLHVRTPAGAWTGLPPSIGGGLASTSTAYDRIFIDDFGQKWIIVRSETNFNLTRGLLVLETRNTPDDPDDDAFRFFDQKGANGQGLTGTSVTAVVEDLEGLVWVGTTEGLAYLPNTGIVAEDPTALFLWPQWADRSRGIFALLGLKINDLAVDPANRLWVASDEGAWLLELVEGVGYELAAHLTTDSAPLFSNIITAIEVDPFTGRVYLATDQGLQSFQGDALAPARTVQDLLVYPNPLYLQDNPTPEVSIRGLVETTELRIVTVEGILVARLSTRGGQARWDARDLEGHLVPSGIYLVVAVGQQGEGTAYGKVAVIR